MKMKTGGCYISWQLCILVTCFCLAAQLASAQGTGCVAAPAGLTGWWRGEDNADDWTGTNNASSISGVNYTSGLVGRAFTFNGVDGRIIIPNSPTLNFGRDQDFSIETWINTLNHGGSFGIMVLLDKRASGAVGYVFYLDNGLPALRISDAGGGVPFTAGGADLRDGLYHHLAVIVDRTSTTGGRFYVDGQLVSTFDPTSVRGDLSNSDPLRIGMNSDPALQMFYGGLLDELSIYSRALSFDEVQSIYRAGASGKCTVATPPAILVQPVDQTVVVSSSATFAVGAAGSGPLAFQWLFNGNPLAGATDSSLLLTDVTTAQAGLYSVQVTNHYGSVLSSNAQLTVTVIPPSIITQPTNQTIVAGYPSSFAVAAEGSPPLFCQWMKDGDPIPGASDFTLAFPSTQTNDAGTYSAFVTNIAGAVLSSNAVLTVLIAPPCLPPPSDITAWWRGERDTFDSAGTNNASSLTGVTYTNGLVGQAFAFDGIGGRIIVPDSPSLDFAPGQNFSIECWMNTLDQGGAYGIMVLVDKRLRGGLGYVFYTSDGRPSLRLTDSRTSAVFIAPEPDLRDGQYHHVAVTLDRNSVTGGKFYVDGQLVYTFDPTTVSGDLSNSDPLRIGMNSDPMYANFYGGALDELSIYARSLSASEVAVIYNAGSGGKCFTPTPPTIITQPGDQTAYLGLNASLSVLAGGSPPLSYQWTFNGEPLNDQTNAALVLTTVTSAQAGAYNVVVRNAYGSVTSETAHVTVALQAPYIVEQPQNVTVTVGQDASFSVTASGSPPLSYQWLYEGTAIDGATGSSLSLAHVSFEEAGQYSVVVTNEAGLAASSEANLRVNFLPASIRILSTSGQSGHPLSVPVAVVANGNENAVAFSLNFDTSLLTYAEAAPGSDVTGGALLVNDTQAAMGKVGFALGLGAGSTLAPGTQQVVLVTFNSAVRTSPASTTISFGDTPLARQLADQDSVLLPANYFSGPVLLSAADFEADLSPRPEGNKAVDLSDWVLAGRYAARLDYPTNASEFQRADCAPRASAGDGAITVSDWVQAGRYAAKLDPLTLAGGPTSEGGKLKARAKDLSPRQVRVPSMLLLEGQTGTVPVWLEAQGDENALGFSISFDPARLTFQSAAAGAGVPGAMFNVNAQGASEGKLGFVLALSSGSSIAAGTREIVKLTFRAADSAGDSSLALTDQPVPREVSNPLASALDVSYIDGTLSVMGPPELQIQPAADGVALAWPGWATNFALQSAASPNGGTGGWTNLLAPIISTNGLQQTTVPAAATEQYYRLLQTQGP